MDRLVKRSCLLQVIVGDFVRGKPDMLCPPHKDPDIPMADVYDSCVDCVEDPKIFVVFERWQAYPEYLIEYE